MYNDKFWHLAGHSERSRLFLQRGPPLRQPPGKPVRSPLITRAVRAGLMDIRGMGKPRSRGRDQVCLGSQSLSTNAAALADEREPRQVVRRLARVCDVAAGALSRLASKRVRGGERNARWLGQWPSCASITS